MEMGTRPCRHQKLVYPDLPLSDRVGDYLAKDGDALD